MSFRLVTKSMTLNDLGEMALILRYFSELKVVEDKRKLSATEI